MNSYEKCADIINQIMHTAGSIDMVEIRPAIEATLDYFGVSLDEDKFIEEINFQSVNKTDILYIINNFVDVSKGN
jgi:hypothetical protein